MVSVESVTKVFRSGPKEVRVLEDISLVVRAGEFLAVMGPSGSGKTTLLNLMAGVDRPTSGRVVVAGVEPAFLKEGEAARWRNRHIGYIFQTFNLIPVLTAFENVELPLLRTGLSRRERREQVSRCLDLVGLGNRSDHLPNELSGGQQQRVAIARAIATDPSLILADEPTGDLDAESAHEVLELLGSIHQDLGKTIVLVTHDRSAASRAERLVQLVKGRLVSEGAL
jgi:putative ABC transport system ATP-binding protein